MSEIHSRSFESSEEESKVTVEGERKIKRLRVKRTCLACKKRKTKCDRVHPCAPCATRGEASSCEFERPHAEALGLATVPLDDFLALQARMQRLEAQFVPPTPTSGPLRDKHSAHGADLPRDTSHGRAAGQEKAFTAIEGLAGMRNPESARLESDPARSVASSSGSAKLWPDIALGPMTVRSHKWNRDLREVFDALPSVAQMDFMVDFFFSEIQVIRRFLHEGVFRGEISQFMAFRSMGMAATVDSAWLSQLVCVLWVTCHFLSDNPSENPTMEKLGLSHRTLIEMATRLFDALENALTCADWMFKPQFRILQTLLIGTCLNRQSVYYSGVVYGPQGESARSMWYDVAVGICKGLRLHLRTTVEDIATLNDPALPLAQPLYTTQVARRAFHNVLFLDTFNLCADPEEPHCFSPYSFPDGSFLTPPPANYTDQALFSVIPVKPQAAWEKTTFVWEIHLNNNARHWRDIVAALDHTGTFPYQKVLDCSQELRESHQDFLSIRATNDLVGNDLTVFDLLNSSYHQRFVRLHRPFLLRSYQEDQYSQSRHVLLSSARQIVRIHRKLLVESPSCLLVRNALYLFVHHISSLLVLFMNALIDVHSRPEIRQQLAESTSIFRQACFNTHHLRARGAARGYFVAAEMIKLIDRPPLDVDNVEEILRGIESRASADERALLNSMASEPVGMLPVMPSSFWAGVGDGDGVVNLAEASGMQSGWDIDWGIFVRDL